MLFECLPYFHEVQHPIEVLEQQTQSLENQFSIKKNIFISRERTADQQKGSENLELHLLVFRICKRLEVKGCRIG